MAKDYFPKVKEAREALRAKAEEIIAKQMLIIEMAIERGDLEAAGKLNQWLIEHMPRGDEGETVIDQSAAAPKEVAAGPTGPTIQIGIALGGMKDHPKQIAGETIDVTPVPVPNPKALLP